MLVIERDNLIYYMSKDNLPSGYCNSGDMIRFETYDCFKNTLIAEGTKLGIDNPKMSNPATGPLYVIGAKPGDTLKVEIIDISVGSIGICGSGPTVKCLNEKLDEYRIKRIKVNNDRAEIFDNVSIPIEPMIGTIGVAPQIGVVETGLAGNHGGNMDCRQIKKGAILYLPVFTEGALLSLGDLHALMGDGEIGDVGLEIEGNVTLKVEIVPNTNRKTPSVYVDEKWITIATNKTLEAASEDATLMMFEFVEQLGIDKYDVGIILTLCANLVICQQCGFYKTVRMELNLNILSQMGYSCCKFA